MICDDGTFQKSGYRHCFFARPSVTTNRAPCESCERVATQPLRLFRLWLLALVELVYLH